MFPVRHSPVWILVLILISAGLVLVLGFLFSRETEVVTIEQDRAPLSRFTSELLKEVKSLEELYESGILDALVRIGTGENTLRVASVCREIVGAEQAIVVQVDRALVSIDLRESDRSEPLPLPRRKGEEGIGDSFILDFDDLERGAFASGFHWLEPSGRVLYFSTMLNYETAFVLRIDRDAVIRAADEWLASWTPDLFAPVQASGITASVHSPLKNVVVSTGEAEANEPPNLILPVSSAFGEWTVTSSPQTKVVTSYKLPVMLGSAALAIVLVLAGIFGFVQQCKALRLAEQRVSFVNRVSHELRTPMTNILLNVDLLDDSLSEKNRIVAKRLGLVREEAGRLSRLLENVLCFSRREKLNDAQGDPGQTLRVISCEVNEMIDSVLDQFGPTLRRKSITVTRGGDQSPLSVLADQDALAQIFSNLISNVEKYAAGGGRLVILSEVSSSGEWVILSVIDFGPGIPGSDASRIFSPFVRLNEATKEGVSGTGLGLSIARDLTESMNGTLVIDLEKKSRDEGARFVLALPRAAENLVNMAS